MSSSSSMRVLGTREHEQNDVAPMDVDHAEGLDAAPRDQVLTRVVDVPAEDEQEDCARHSGEAFLGIEEVEDEDDEYVVPEALRKDAEVTVQELTPEELL